MNMQQENIRSCATLRRGIVWSSKRLEKNNGGGTHWYIWSGICNAGQMERPDPPRSGSSHDRIISLHFDSIRRGSSWRQEDSGVFDGLSCFGLETADWFLSGYYFCVWLLCTGVDEEE